MDELKDKIIDQIISLLMPLRNEYPSEINNITNELINGKTNKLEDFVFYHFNNLNCSKQVKDFVEQLVNSGFLDFKFLELTKDNYKFTTLTVKDILSISSKPLNLTEDKFENMKKNLPSPTINTITKEYETIDFNNLNKESKESIQTKNINQSDNYLEDLNTQTPYLDDYLPINDLNLDTTNNIDDLRKKILEAQLNYLNNAASFIENLEQSNEFDLYNALIDLNDIRYIQHSLSKVSTETLERLLPFMENKIESNNHSSIDMFIIDVIKKYLHIKVH